MFFGCAEALGMYRNRFMAFWNVFVVILPLVSIEIVRSRKLVWLVGSSVSQLSLLCLFRSSLNCWKVLCGVFFHMMRISSMVLT